MTTVVPPCELTRKAIKWISEQHSETGKPLKSLLEEAAMRFNLSPKDMEFMERFYAESNGEARTAKPDFFDYPRWTVIKSALFL